MKMKIVFALRSRQRSDCFIIRSHAHSIISGASRFAAFFPARTRTPLLSACLRLALRSRTLQLHLMRLLWHLCH
jgi:hypothetical protein